MKVIATLRTRGRQVIAWLKRIGTWMLVALAAVLPVLGWLSERRKRREAEAAWAHEIARTQRAIVTEVAIATVKADHAEAVKAIAVDTESVAAPHEAAAAAVRAIDTEDPATWDALAAELDKTARPR
jgi:cytochrome b561